MMGRLIDMDALKTELEAVNISEESTIANYVRRVFIRIMDGAPTVEAIPVEWMREWMRGHTRHKALIVGDMILDWNCSRMERGGKT